MKIYFAGSIRGGREDKDLYLEIINFLKNYGEVLTEHVGDKSLSSYGQKSMTDEEIYTKDTNWIHEADIIIAEVSTPSLGVGYEIAFAESLNKRIVLLYREAEGKRLSAMLKGNNKFEIINYSNFEELKSLLDLKFK
jgi:2'-deoxynucleoside 5'-phosphate N-hydrolase